MIPQTAVAAVTALDAMTVLMRPTTNPGANIAAVVFGISGTYGTAVVIAEAQLVSGGTWFPVNMTNLASKSEIAGGNISLTDNASYLLKVTDTTNYYDVRLKLVSIVSGQVDINGNGIQAQDMPNPTPPIVITVANTAQTVNVASATALTVGPNGTTNPTLNVNTNTASAATGITIVGAAAAGGVAITVTSSGTNEPLNMNAKGSGVMNFGGTSTGQIYIGRGALKTPVLGLTLTSLGTTQNSTPTAAQLLGGLVTQTGATGAGTFTLPSGTTLSAAMGLTPAVGDTFDCTFANLGGSQTITITGATGTTVLGTAAVPTGKFATMRFINTGTNTWNIYCNVSA